MYQVHLIDRFIDDDEIPGIFAGNGMAVLPYTFFYGQSGALAHAMEYGLPVVASDVGGLGESVRKWKVGRCVAPDDPKALAEGIRMAAEPAEYWSAKAAIEKIRDKLKWKHTAEITWDAYRSVLNI